MIELELCGCGKQMVPVGWTPCRDCLLRRVAELESVVDTDQLKAEGFVNVADCPRCELLKSQLARLQSIVDKLSKCWRLVDGVLVQDCPVVIGETELWWCPPAYSMLEPCFLGICFCITYGMKLGRPHAYGLRGGGPHAIDDCCNTREAAEALLKEREDSG